MSRNVNSLFPGFEERRVRLASVNLAVLVGGSGPPILLLHGYPQTRAAWHRLAPVLARSHTVVVPDLPGYGGSAIFGRLEGSGSKRWMGQELHAMMRQLGHDSYIVVGHDRGARAGYRMALDLPQAVRGFVPISVVPTPEMWEGASKAFGINAWHWFMLAQPEPLPEIFLSANPRMVLDLSLDKMAQGLERLHPLALEDYRIAFDDPTVRHAICEDYRAGATVDEADDLADRAAGRKIGVPVLVLWEAGRRYGGGRKPIDIWKDWAIEVSGIGISGGHMLPETAADEVLEMLVPFLERVTNVPRS
ncbi:alpha/beta hydrolase [Pseudorhizobium halotolerans]|uniref:Alpha/beta hydrolase n=1 Tax=Pseudorhizobium halotolerans TaxID=1233081 RepID=A0ABN7JVG8_9HYPH|nr:alpha/beta hydrolase [Pseudorhizobium halotolerans]CAD7050274.1 alpha/beta hydrolase [Pseudorhizobium halotolerans]